MRDESKHDLSRKVITPYHFIDHRKNWRLTFDGWRGAIGSMFAVAAEPEEIGFFEGNIAAWMTNRVLLSGIQCSTLRLHRSTQAIACDGIDHFAISLVSTGSIVGIAGTMASEAEAGDVVFSDLLQTRRSRLSLRGELTEEITLWVPRSRLLASVSDDHALHGVVLKGSSAAGAVIGAALRALYGHTESLTLGQMDALADGIIECAARASAPILRAAATGHETKALASFVSIRRFIDRHLTSFNLDQDFVAKSFGLSRATLYRPFEPVGGVAGYIRQQRLRKAYQEITAPELANRRIAMIAHEAGFKNSNSFNRAFRAAYGLSPGEARDASLANSRDTILTSVQNPKSLTSLLLQLQKASSIGG